MVKNWDGFTLRKKIAMGDKDAMNVGDYGVAHLDSHDAGNHPGPEKHLKDHERAARPPIDRNQANPDHGPHRAHE